MLVRADTLEQADEIRLEQLNLFAFDALFKVCLVQGFCRSDKGKFHNLWAFECLMSVGLMKIIEFIANRLVKSHKTKERHCCRSGYENVLVVPTFPPA